MQAVAGATNQAEKRQRMLPFLERVVDLDGVARFCLGRYWLAATPDQQREYLRLFRLQLANGVAGRLTQETSGTAQVITGRPQMRDAGLYVPTTIERPNNKPNQVSWLVVMVGSQMKIADVVAEGMSLRLTQRSDYASFLSRNGGDVGALLAAMRAQSERVE